MLGLGIEIKQQTTLAGAEFLSSKFVPDKDGNMYLLRDPFKALIKLPYVTSKQMFNQLAYA